VSKVVLDTSAFLAMANREPGADRVMGVLKESVMSAVNAAEVLQKLVQKGMTLDHAEDYVRRFVSELKEFNLTQATITASLVPRTKLLGLSLGDRACLALGKLLNVPVLTADQAWGQLNVGVTVELIRGKPQSVVTAREAVDHALTHAFERASVVGDRRLLAVALKRGYGSVMPEEAQRDFDGRKDVIRRRYGEENYVTTREVLAEEAATLAFAQEGRGKFRPIDPEGAKFNSDQLNPEQRDAVRHVLSSRDRVVLIRGAAGTRRTCC
jgi:PIN domain nuclease of toxin-antitoxin system